MNIREALEDLCVNVRNERSSFRPSTNLTNRAAWVINKITEMELTYTLDAFLPSRFYLPFFAETEEADPRYYNIIVKFPSVDPENEESVIFTAHHDISNPNSQNCQDNSASVVNLLKLCSILKEKNDLNRNVYVVFTDGEEFGGKGACRVSEQVLKGEFGQLKYIVNSELTAFGEFIWAERSREFSSLRRKLIECTEGEFYEKFVPFNDSFVFRAFNIDSICLGILPKNNQGELETRYWHICHSEHDTIQQANYDHMERYVQFLLKLI